MLPCSPPKISKKSTEWKRRKKKQNTKIQNGCSRQIYAEPKKRNNCLPFLRVHLSFGSKWFLLLFLYWCVSARARARARDLTSKSLDLDQRSNDCLCGPFAFYALVCPFSKRFATCDHIKTLLFLNFGSFLGISFCFSCFSVSFEPCAYCFPVCGCAFATLLLEFLIIMILKAFSNERNRLFRCEITTHIRITCEWRWQNRNGKYENKCSNRRKKTVQKQQPKQNRNEKNKINSFHLMTKKRVYCGLAISKVFGTQTKLSTRINFQSECALNSIEWIVIKQLNHARTKLKRNMHSSVR